MKQRAVAQHARQFALGAALILLFSLVLQACGGSSGQSGQQQVNPQPPSHTSPPAAEDEDSGITVISGKA